MADTPSIIQGALDKILGPASTSAAGTSGSGIDLGTPKTPLSYIAGAFDQGGGATTQNVSNATPNYVPPDVLAARASAEESARQLAALQQQISSYNTPAPAAAAAAAPAAAAAAPAAKPALMTLSDYDTWMRELYNQKVYQDYGGNVKFRDPSQGSWTDWLKTHGDRMSQAKPVFNIGGSNYGAAGKTTMVDPTTGQVPGQSIRYMGYGAAYRPQTGDYAKDWQITNMVKGGGAAPSLASAAAQAGGGGSPLTAPVRPTGRNVSWQQDQQYWRDMDAYRKAGGK